MQPKISVIVPVYQTEQYLSKCLDSILNQSLKELEVIVIDDGSKDNSPKIIDEYARRDSRIRVVHKANEGQGIARNIGIDMASAKYVTFVDSDDWVDTNVYENILNRIEDSGADLAVYSRRSYLGDGTEKFSTCVEDKVNEKVSNNLEKHTIEKLLYSQTVVCSNKIYKKKIVDKYGIRFMSVCDIGAEDALFNYQYLCHIGKVVNMKNLFYNNLIRNTSTVHTYSEGYMKRTGNLIAEVKNCNRKNRIDNDIDIVFFLFFHQYNLMQLHKFCTVKESNRYISKEINEAMKNEGYRDTVNKIVFNPSTASRVMKALGYRISGRLYTWSIMLLINLKQYRLVARLM